MQLLAGAGVYLLKGQRIHNSDERCVGGACERSRRQGGMAKGLGEWFDLREEGAGVVDLDEFVRHCMRACLVLV